MERSEKCKRCGSPLHAGTLEGLCGFCLAAFAFETEPGDGGLVVGDYELLQEIARGGMGVVYRARDLRLNRIVAIKMVLHGPFSSQEFVRRFQIEAEAAAQLQHPHIVTIYDVGQDEGRQYIAMEFVEGRSFAELAEAGPLEAKRAAEYLAKVAHAIHHAHQKGVIHRDLKPSNILLDQAGEPRITDFGLAKLLHLDSGLTISGQSLGSPHYMPPEQAAWKRGTADVSGDVYSLGAVLYHLITGRPPFHGDSLQDVLSRVQSAEPEAPRRLNPRVPVDLETICLRCLEKEPAKRYGSAQQLADDLERFGRGEPIAARPVSNAEKLWRWARRHPGPASLASALALALVLGIAGVLLEWRVARDYAETMRLNLYAADVNLASQALQDGDLGQARRVLGSLEPRPGEHDLRGFEWRYLSHLCRGQQLATLEGHGWIVTCLGFSPDGTLLATGAMDGTARIWNSTTMELLWMVPNQGGTIWSVAFSPDGKELVTAGNVRQVEVWDARTGTRKRTFPGHLAALSPDGSVLATTASGPFFWESAARIALWDFHTGKQLRETESAGRMLAFSRNGSILAAAGEERGVQLFEVATGALIQTLETSNAVWSMAFSPDGSQLLAAGWSNVATVWDLASRKRLRELKDGPRALWGVSFSPDGRQVAMASSNQAIHLWDAVTWTLLGELKGHANEAWCVAYRPEGQLLASGGKDQTVRLWKPSPPKAPVEIPSEHEHRPVLARFGPQVEVTNPKTGAREVWNIATGQREPSGIGAFNGPAFEIGNDGKVRVWDGKTGETLGIFHGPPPPTRCATLAPNGRKLALATERENVAHIFDVVTGRDTPLKGHRDFVSGLAFSPDGARVASASMDGKVKLWNSDTGKEIAEFPGHLDEATDVSFSPDGATLASIGRKDSVKMWHLATGRELLSVPMLNAGKYLEFSSDGKTLVVTTEDDRLLTFATE